MTDVFVMFCVCVFFLLYIQADPALTYAELDMNSGHTEQHVPQNPNEVTVYSSIVVWTLVYISAKSLHYLPYIGLIVFTKGTRSVWYV